MAGGFVKRELILDKSTKQKLIFCEKSGRRWKFSVRQHEFPQGFLDGGTAGLPPARHQTFPYIAAYLVDLCRDYLADLAEGGYLLPAYQPDAFVGGHYISTDANFRSPDC